MFFGRRSGKQRPSQTPMERIRYFTTQVKDHVSKFVNNGVAHLRKAFLAQFQTTTIPYGHHEQEEDAYTNMTVVDVADSYAPTGEATRFSTAAHTPRVSSILQQQQEQEQQHQQQQQQPASLRPSQLPSGLILPESVQNVSIHFHNPPQPATHTTTRADYANPEGRSISRFVPSTRLSRHNSAAVRSSNRRKLLKASRDVTGQTYSSSSMDGRGAKGHPQRFSNRYSTTSSRDNTAFGHVYHQPPPSSSSLHHQRQAQSHSTSEQTQSTRRPSSCRVDDNEGVSLKGFDKPSTSFSPPSSSSSSSSSSLAALPSFSRPKRQRRHEETSSPHHHHHHNSTANLGGKSRRVGDATRLSLATTTIGADDNTSTVRGGTTTTTSSSTIEPPSSQGDQNPFATRSRLRPSTPLPSSSSAVITDESNDFTIRGNSKTATAHTKNPNFTDPFVTSSSTAEKTISNLPATSSFAQPTNSFTRPGPSVIPVTEEFMTSDENEEPAKDTPTNLFGSLPPLLNTTHDSAAPANPFAGLQQLGKSLSTTNQSAETLNLFGKRKPTDHSTSDAAASASAGGAAPMSTPFAAGAGGGGVFGNTPSTGGGGGGGGSMSNPFASLGTSMAKNSADDTTASAFTAPPPNNNAFAFLSGTESTTQNKPFSFGK